MLNFLYIGISWVLLRWHDLFSTFLDERSGISWALSIFMLVVTIRILLFRFFIKQVHSQRKMQEVQPKIAALREKYKNDRQTLSQEMMKLQKEEGFNPLSGCWPILLQAPVFIALFHVLRLIGTNKAPALYQEYHWTQEQSQWAGAAKLFGGAPIAASFRDDAARAATLGGELTTTRIVAGILIVLMVAATYITQRQIISRTSQTQVVDGQQAMIQKLLLYGMPASLLVSGFLFPIGVLLYWFTNNLWTMGQQFYILKRMPHPNAQKTERDPAVAKALAPKPGQKPVRPERRAVTAADGDGDGTATGTAAPKPGAKPAPGAKAPGKGAKGKAGETRAGANGKAAGPADGASAGGSGTDGAAADGGDGSGDGSGATPAGGSGAPRAGGGKPGGGRPAGGNRRPQGQRSPTQTRQKKKRR